jgi:iron complex outermembrane receptor protein
MFSFAQRRIYAFFVAALLIAPLAAPPPTRAEEPMAPPAEALTEMNLEDLMQVTVYGASKFEQPLSEAPSSVSIITADQIRKYGFRTLADVLQSLRGFFITNDRNYTYLGVRGFGPSGDYNSRILVLVDGHRINENIYDSVYISNEFILDVDLIDRMEVIRGPGSSLYGDNAFFGVINIITRKGKQFKGVELSGLGGNQETYKGRISYGNRFANGLEMLVSGTVYGSEGDESLYYPAYDPLLNPDNLRAANDGTANHLDYERSQSFFASFSLADVTLTSAFVNRVKGVPTASYSTLFDDSRYQYTDRRWYADLKYQHTFPHQLNVQGRLFYDQYFYFSDNPYQPPPDTYINKDSAWNSWWGGDLQLSTVLFDKHRLIAGAEFQDNVRQRFQNYDVDPYLLNLDLNRPTSKVGLYLQDEYSILSNLILNLGVRYDYFNTFGSTVNPRVGLIYLPVAKTSLKLLYGSAFRAPNTYELYYEDGVYQKGNPDLEPEKLQGLELIYEQFLGDHLMLTATGFYNQISKLIRQEMDSDGLLVFRNLQDVNAWGTELELNGKWDNGVQGYLSYTYLTTEDQQTHQQLVNSPHHLAKLNLVVPLYRDKLFSGLGLVYQSPRKTLAGEKTDNLFLANLTLFSQNLLPGLQLSGSIYNLFNQHYRDPAGEDLIGDDGYGLDTVAQDGLTFRVKLTYSF